MFKIRFFDLLCKMLYNIFVTINFYIKVLWYFSEAGGDFMIEITTNDAFQLLQDCDNIVYAQVMEKEIILSNLNELAVFFRKYKGEGTPFSLYWRG